ncbi:hypothetical protein BCR33DRAFT_864776 [Rhizoclosmatium globosum]|uniref:G-protein coupled receptors family 3 profile domain-containing protein n=1 Tax=Rhizoclosmatium globosum TaxID=329046 RepID=A0A1Y1ZHV7_9FUNG|nr:hypothetical protein BCR33DRAFT_864776 [Rhizoclosmatium globosum]|eukprot:ORY09784.1 hypothetical protein BCR33DRAFT_864776 [Rhizoclosmatium globosum]
MSQSWTVCPSSGTKVCSGTDAVFTTTGPISLSNCVYSRCPPIVVPAGTSATISGVTFRDAIQPSNVNGGALQINGGVVTLNNVYFTNNTAGNGGAISIDNEGQLTAMNVYFNSNFASNPNDVGGGDLIMSHSSKATCTNCHSANSRTLSNGAASSIQQTSTLNWIGGTCINNTAHWAGCFMSDTKSVTNAQDIYAQNLTAGAGAFNFLNQASTFVGKNVTVVGALATGQAGCLYSYGSGTTNCTNCRFTGCYTQGFGGAGVIQAGSTGYFYNTIFEGSTSPGGAGSLFAISNAVITLDGGSVIRNSVGLYGGAFWNDDSNVIITGGSSIKNCSATHGGAYFGITGGSLSLNNGAIIGCSADSIGGAIHAIDKHTLYLGDGVQVANNVASNGGAIYLDLTSSATVNGSTAFVNNSASTMGGAIMTAGSATLTLIGNLISSSANSAPFGTFVAITTLPPFDMTSTAVTNNPLLSGNIYVSNTATGLQMLQKKNFIGLPNIKLFGGASQLVLEDSSTINNTIINFAAPLPPFSVHAQDVFGNTVPANLNAPVIVQVASTSNAAMSGDNTKAIVNATSNAAQFSGLRLANPVAGNYTFVIRGFPGSLQQPPGALWQTFQITISVCDQLTQRLSTGTNTCVDIVNTSDSTRLGIGAAAIVCIVFGLFNLICLFFFRELKLIKANSLVFLSLTNVGCLLCLASLVIQISTAQNSCTAAAAVDNIGFALIFGSLLVKTSRIRIIFDEKLRRKIKVPTDAKLSAWVLAFLVFMGGLLAAWFVVQSPEPVDMITASMAVTTRCNTATTFGVIVTIVRIVIIMFSAVLSFQIRDVPSTFNESKMLGFSAYNWFLFSALLNALVVFAINDPNTAFAIGGVAIIVPTVTTIFLLISVKVQLCIFNPIEANKIETTTSSTGADLKSTMSHAQSRMDTQGSNNNSVRRG